MSEQNSKYLLELRNVSKYFPGVKALDNVSLTLRAGSVLALVGENGAGKSTLIKIITGVFKPSEGEMYVKGEKVSFNTTLDAFKAGISAVHQERNIISTFSIAENMLLETISEHPGAVIRVKEHEERIRKYLELVGLNVDIYQSINTLRAGQQQLLEVARAMMSDAKIIMLDEPTASISRNESEILLETVERLRDQGYAFIFVSHKLEEVFRIADDVCVIRDGVNVGEECAISDISRDELITRMIGRTESKKVFAIRDKTNEAVVLKAENLVRHGHSTPVSFELHKGEILGWYGLVGAGRTELAREVIGADPVESGRIELNGKPVKLKGPAETLKDYHIAYVSENRNLEGLFLTYSIRKNISSSVWKEQSSKAGIHSAKKEKQLADEFIRKIQIKTPSMEQSVVNLSGGNRQKVSFAKTLAVDPEIMIIDEPTVGIDLKTKEEIHEIILELTEQGKSVILISSDLSEMIRIADRILVVNDFAICGDMINTKDYQQMSTAIMEKIVLAK